MSSTAIITLVIAGLTIVLFPTAALAQSRAYRDHMGRVTGRSMTLGKNTTFSAGKAPTTGPFSQRRCDIAECGLPLMVPLAMASLTIGHRRRTSTPPAAFTFIGPAERCHAADVTQ
jgi:hypothetical protein